MKLPGRISLIQLVLIGGGIFILLMFFLPRPNSVPDLEISQVLQMAKNGQVTKIRIQGNNLDVTTSDGRVFKSIKESSVSIVELLDQRGGDAGAVQIEVEEQGRSYLGLFLSILPLIIFGGLIFYLVKRTRGGINQAMGFGRSQARLILENRPAVRFDDVAGVDEVKEDLAEVVEFLKQPEKFSKLGAKIPRGVLLAGPPGTGKTLVSKAVAGEAEVPFFSISGSEFVEMFVGVGASRVRALFNTAKENAPAIIFIDEIDAVGRHRGAGIGGGNDEREQTLNQILVEMDGFDTQTNIIVIAATNRPDILDPALLRPGRFDRRVMLGLPDVKGREAILKVHMKGKPVHQDVDVPGIARQSHGFSGADLANLVNEAAISAARNDRDSINSDDLEESIDRVMAGPARKNRQANQKEREIVAYHEAGHALVAANLTDADPVHKVTIVARGAAGGYTRLLPEEDRGLWSKGQFEATLAVMMGGQQAEALVFGDITTGASNDLQNANGIARKMVTEYGMSDQLGPQTFDNGQEMMFLGKELAQGRRYSDAVAHKIDNEISKLLDTAQQKAKQILHLNRVRLTLIAGKLLDHETLEGPELQKLLVGTADEEPLPA